MILCVLSEKPNNGRHAPSNRRRARLADALQERRRSAASRSEVINYSDEGGNHEHSLDQDH
jgi:hypothetical protein